MQSHFLVRRPPAHPIVQCRLWSSTSRLPQQQQQAQVRPRRSGPPLAATWSLLAEGSSEEQTSEQSPSPLSQVRRLSGAIKENARAGELLHVLKLCRPLREACQQSNQKPDPAVFHALLQAFAQYGYFTLAIHTLQDMIHCGIPPSLHAFNLAISAATHPGHDLSPIFAAMKTAGLEPNETTHHQLILRYAQASNLEGAMLELEAVQAMGRRPLLESYNAVALLAIEHGEPRLAHDILIEAEAGVEPQQTDSNTNTKTYIPPQTWFQLLEAAAAEHYLPALLDGIDRLQHNDFTEGLLLNMLNSAGRRGSPQLAEHCLAIIQKQSSQANLTVPVQEWHYAPVVEAYCRDGQINEAIEAVNRLNSCFKPKSSSLEEFGARLHTVLPLKDLFLSRLRAQAAANVAIQKCSPDSTEGATPLSQNFDQLEPPFALLQRLHAEDTLIDVSVFNAALLALIESDQLHQALIEFKQFGSNLDLLPNADTYNILLLGCIRTGHLLLGQQLMLELQSQQATPDQTTYERMIYLCLSVRQGAGEVDEAFGYLEALKSFNATPGLEIYRAFLLRLVDDGDARSVDVRLEVESLYGEASTSAASRIGRGTTTKKPHRPRRARSI